jgi:hypothetical protein
VSVAIAARNLSRVAWNQVAKRWRHGRQRVLRRFKGAREAGKEVKASVRGSIEQTRDAGTDAYAGSVRTMRYWRRVHAQTIPRLTRELSVRRELRRVAAGTHPIIVGPWLSEVGYEVLYWVPFLRWFADRYSVDPARLVVVSRGGVAEWYADVATRYVELFDLFTPDEFARQNAERQTSGEQKQHVRAAFDQQILARVQAQPGLADALVCHPSTMFRLLRQFWLGNEALAYVQEHTRHRLLPTRSSMALPPLPERFVAVKLYAGKAIPDTPDHRQALRLLVEQAASRLPIVALDTGFALDDHTDYLFRDIPGVIDLRASLTPQNNLGLQTAVLQRATRFITTCGGLAWLAPFMGVETLAVYASDELLNPHLYAARQAYLATGAAPFVPLDLAALASVPGYGTPGGG